MAVDFWILFFLNKFSPTVFKRKKQTFILQHPQSRKKMFYMTKEDLLDGVNYRCLCLLSSGFKMVGVGC